MGSPAPDVLHTAAYHNDVLVGAIGCRLESAEEGSKRLYIILLGVLAPYRGMLTGGLFDMTIWCCACSALLWSMINGACASTARH